MIVLLLSNAWVQAQEHTPHYARLTAEATDGGKIVIPELSYYATGTYKVPNTPKPADYVSYQERNITCIKEGVTSGTNYTDGPRLFLFANPETGYEFKGIYNEKGEKMAWLKHATKTNLYWMEWTNMTSGYNPGTMDKYPIELNMTVVFAPSSSTEQQLTAEQREGYEFIGWQVHQDNGNEYYLSFNSTTFYYARTGETISPIYHSVSDPTPYFAVGKQMFSSLSDACDYAIAGGYSKVILVGSGVLNENATVPAGIQLIIPHDGSLIGYQYWLDFGHELRYGKAYRTLTIASGCTLTVDGVLSVSARQTSLAPSGCGSSSTVYEDYGLLQLSENAKLLLTADAELYAYGYVSGDGEVELLDGATVYEMFQIMDWRGAGYLFNNLSSQMKKYQDNLERWHKNLQYYQAGTMTWQDVLQAGLKYPSNGFEFVTIDSEQKILPQVYTADMIFPLNQYYIQNVESRMLFHQGAQEKVSATIYASMDVHFDPFTFIGSDEGLFQLRDGATLIKSYDVQNDRQVYEIQGQVELENIHLSSKRMLSALGLVTQIPMDGIHSELYTLPLAHNMDIHLVDNTVAELHTNMYMLPGASIQIDHEATLRIAAYAALYLHDTNDWNGYNLGGKGDYIDIEYSHAGGLASTRPHVAPGDASLLVNGRVEILTDTITWEQITAYSDYDIVEQMETIIRSKGNDPMTDYKQAIQGALYTSRGGANICSPEGTGTITRQGVCGKTTSIQHSVGTDGSRTTSISVSSPVLQNGDGSTTMIPCDADITYLYDANKNRWVDENEPEECTRVVTARAAAAGTGAVMIEIVEE